MHIKCNHFGVSISQRIIGLPRRNKKDKRKKNLNRLAHAQSRLLISAFMFEEDIYVYWIYEWETDLYTGSITNLNRDHFLVLNAILYDYTCMHIQTG